MLKHFYKQFTFVTLRLETRGARELITLAILKYVQDNNVFFSNNPSTYGRCKDQYETGYWAGHYIELGGVVTNSDSVFGGLVVDAYPISLPDIGLFCYQVCSE